MAEVVLVLDTYSGGCPIQDHVHLTSDTCALLVFGYVRRIDVTLKQAEIARDLYTECVSTFERLYYSLTQQSFELGDWYTGFECQIDALGLKSGPDEHSLHMRFRFNHKQVVRRKKKYAARRHSEIPGPPPQLAFLRWVWLDYEGKPIDYGTRQMLLDRPFIEQQTFVSHPWKLFNNGRFMGLYVPTSKHTITLSEGEQDAEQLMVTIEKVH